MIAYIILLLAVALSAHAKSSVNLVLKKDHSEDPKWCDKSKLLFFTSKSNFCSYDPSTKEEKCVPLSGFLHFVVLGKEDKTFYVGRNEKEVLKVCWDGKSSKVDSVEKLAELPNDMKGPNMRGGAADSVGRVIFSVTDLKTKDNSAVFSLDKAKNLKKRLSGLQKADAGACKSKNQAYLTETYGKQVAIYDYDVDTGKFSNRKKLDLSSLEVKPDPRGIAVDADDNLWIIFPGKVVQVDPTGKLLSEHVIPVSGANCLAWGGKNLDILYVSSIKQLLTEEQKKEQPDCGSLYSITNTGAKGKVENRADI